MQLLVVDLGRGFGQSLFTGGAEGEYVDDKKEGQLPGTETEGGRQLSEAPVETNKDKEIQFFI